LFLSVISDTAMSCLSPLTVHGKDVPCGKCSSCLALKAWVLRARMVAECHAAPRSWFVTLTLRRQMSDATGYRLVQRFLKRVRKGRGKVKGQTIRYACVAEHGSLHGRLHYHLLMHGSEELSYRSIRNAWRGGISETKMISGSASGVAMYTSKVARYVSKGGARFRMSLGYGSKALADTLTRELPNAIRVLWPDARIRIHGPTMPRKPLPPTPWPGTHPDDLAEAFAKQRPPRLLRPLRG